MEPIGLYGQDLAKRGAPGARLEPKWLKRALNFGLGAFFLAYFVILAGGIAKLGCYLAGLGWRAVGWLLGI